MKLANHHALITGGGTGIGAAIAHALAGEGAKLTLLGRRQEVLERTSDALRAGGAQVATATADVTLHSDVEAGFATARTAHGPVTIFVNNAGAAQAAPFGKVSAEIWRGIMAINLDAVMLCCQAALADLTGTENGRIVTIASTAGLKGYAYAAPYVAAKHGAIGLTRALAIELARTGTTANAVCPGFTATDIVEEAVANIAAKTGRSEADARAELTKFNPQGRLVTSDEVAAAVLWLCLPESGAINGQAIAVAGGEVM